MLNNIIKKIELEDIEKCNKAFAASEAEFSKNFNCWLQENYSQISLSEAREINNNLKQLLPDVIFMVGTQFYDYVIEQYLKSNRKDIFYGMINNVYHRLYWVLAGKSEIQITKAIEDICNVFPDKFSIDKEYFNCLSKMLPEHEGRVANIVGMVSNEIRINILYRSISNSPLSNFHLRTILDFYLKNKEYEDYVRNELYDGSDLCNVLKYANFFMSDQENMKRLLLQEVNRCPQTVEHLLNSAAKERLPTLVLELSNFFVSKKILQKLIEIGDDRYVNKFVNQHPELKDLMVYY